MKNIKFIVVATLTILLTINLSTSVQAKSTKAKTPSVFVAGSTAILTQPDAKDNAKVDYQLYLKASGKYKKVYTYTVLSGGKYQGYIDITKNGDYGLKSIVDGGKPSEMKKFKITKAWNYKGNPEFEFGNNSDNFDILFDFEKTSPKKATFYVYNEDIIATKMKVKFYSIDKNGKMKLVKTATPKIGKDKNYSVDFKLDKAVRNYAISQTYKGKTKEYIHIGLSKDLKKIETMTYGIPH